jgi:hypothetical protein
MRQTVNFIDEEYIAWLQIGQNGRKIARPFKYRARRRPDVHLHFGGNNVRQSGFPEARRATEENVIEGIGALPSGFDKDAQRFFTLRLSDIILKPGRA